MWQYEIVEECNSYEMKITGNCKYDKRSYSELLSQILKILKTKRLTWIISFKPFYKYAPSEKMIIVGKGVLFSDD